MSRDAQPKPRANSSGTAMTMEAMLDQDVREILAVLDQSATFPTSPRLSEATRSSSLSDSPAPAQPPVRSMLDFGDAPADGWENKAPQTQGPVRSMLDVDSPLIGSILKQAHSGPTFAEALRPAKATSNYATSPADFGSTGFRPESTAFKSHGRTDQAPGYQHSPILSLRSVQAVPKRNSQSSSKWSSGFFSDVFRTFDSNTAERGRGSPRMSFGHGSSVPPLNREPIGQTQPLTPGMVALDDGRVVDLRTAFRRFSDVTVPPGLDSRSTRPSVSRIAASSLPISQREQEAQDSEDSSTAVDSDEDERGRASSPRSIDGAPRSRAGKKRRTSGSLPAEAGDKDATPDSSTQPQYQYQYRSLLQPDITFTPPGETGDKSKPHWCLVHPSTSFDQGPASEAVSVVDSDDAEEVADIVRAQRLVFSITPIMPTPDVSRAIRIIYRGEYSKIVLNTTPLEERRLRKYMVATDLSEESTHALEWAIGTLLRDGDTLIAIYCMDDANIVAADGAAGSDESRAPSGLTPLRSNFQGLLDSGSSSLPAKERPKGEEERFRAVQDITDRVVRLLRKTRLQVRVLIEVVHCKNPKHLITEVIDMVSPTLVIIGSRGRGALKGVILGSFSNYLVASSSVPVMVARKRLRKPTKYKPKPQQQVNNLQNPGPKRLPTPTLA